MTVPENRVSHKTPYESPFASVQSCPFREGHMVSEHAGLAGEEVAKVGADQTVVGVVTVKA